MRKLILIGSTFFIYTVTALLCNCQLFADTSQEEVILVKLPEWPPEGNSTYPELSRWKIQIDCADSSQEYYTEETSICLTVKKNQPACVLVTPITLISENTESIYFKPAGVLYPYGDYEAATMKAQWNQGFSADLMHRILQSQKETGIYKNNLNSFISSFNWKKLCETIDGKIIKAENGENTPAFNPWLIDSTRLLDNLCFGHFQASFLNVSGGFNYQLEEGLFTQEQNLLSSFIPENHQLKDKKMIYLKKEQPYYLSDGKNWCMILTGKSVKNISREFINMPIYIEGL